MSSQFSQKDAKAVARDRKSGKARKNKGLNASASLKNRTMSEASTIRTRDIPVVHGNQLVLGNEQTEQKLITTSSTPRPFRKCWGRQCRLTSFPVKREIQARH